MCTLAPLGAVVRPKALDPRVMTTHMVLCKLTFSRQALSKFVTEEHTACLVQSSVTNLLNPGAEGTENSHFVR